MSLLEDIYLGDEAAEAQDLERIIEGDGVEYDDDENDNRNSDDEAEEDKRRVDPTKPKNVRVVQNPRFVLNPARLTGPRGLEALLDTFKDFKFKGKGHEKEDLDLIMKRLEHWAHRLYPKFGFDDCLKKIEQLGKKRAVSVHLTKLRTGQIDENRDNINENDLSDNEEEEQQNIPPEADGFDLLLEEQLAKVRSATTPSANTRSFNPDTPFNAQITSTPYSNAKAPAQKTASPEISAEQRERMLRNRLLAEQRRLERMKKIAEKDKETANEVQMNSNNECSSEMRNETKTNAPLIIEAEKIETDSLNSKEISNEVSKQNDTQIHTVNLENDEIELNDEINKEAKTVIEPTKDCEGEITKPEEVPNSGTSQMEKFPTQDDENNIMMDIDEALMNDVEFTSESEPLVESQL